MKFFEKIDLKNPKLPVFVAASMGVLIVAAAIIGAVVSFSDDGEKEPPTKTQDMAEGAEIEQKPALQTDKDPDEKTAEAESEEIIPETEDVPVPERVPEEIISEPQPEPEPEPVYYIVEDDGWNLILTNPWNELPEDFTVVLQDIGGGHRVDRRIVYALKTMMSDLCQDGRSAFICSSYRTNTKQTNLYNKKVDSYLSQGYTDEDAVVEAGKWVAVPGTSEHQTGLAVDIMSTRYLELDEGQEATAEQQWLMQNSYKYGFILRYPNNKTEITGIYYEPWHYRYVGIKAATEMFEKGICFEEYLAG